MKVKQLIEAFSKLDPNKRVKYQNMNRLGKDTLSPAAILEQGNVYILIWESHPHEIKEELKEGQKLVWHNPNCGYSEHLKKYFPDYKF